MKELKIKDLRVGNILFIPKSTREDLLDDYGIVLANCMATIEDINGDGTLVCLINEKLTDTDSTKRSLEFDISEFLGYKLTDSALRKSGFDDKDYKKGYIGIDVNNHDFALNKPFVLGEFQKDYAFSYNMGSLPMFKSIHFYHELQNLMNELFDYDLKMK